MKQKLLSGFGIIKKQINNVALAATHLVNDDQALTKSINIIKKIIKSQAATPIKDEDNIYYKKTKLESNPIFFIAVVSFHHKKGSIVEFTFPSQNEILSSEESMTYLKSLSDDIPQKTLDNILYQLTYLCLPDGSHSIDKDSQFFLIQNFNTPLYGISCYEQLQVTQAMKEDDQENTRECVQKAMCIVSKIPLFGQMVSKLSVTMSAFFNQDSLKDKKIIQELYTNYEMNTFTSIKVNEILASFSLDNLFVVAKEKIFELLKMIMLEKRILIYSHVSNKVCSFIFSLISLLPGNSFFNLNYGDDIINYNKCFEKFGLPLKCFTNKSKFYSLLSLYDIEAIEQCKSFLVGTTNQIFLNYPKLKFDCVVNIDEGKIYYVDEKKINHAVFKNSKIEKAMYKYISKNCKDLSPEPNSTNENTNYSNFTESEDLIRNAFKNYITNFLIDMDLIIYLSSLEDKEEEIKNILLGHNIDFIKEWIQTSNFKIWKAEHDKNLWMRSKFVSQSTEEVTIYYENGDLYKGEMKNGMRNGRGNLSSKDNQYFYNGNWVNDKKEGQGELFDHGVKYTGNFHNNLFNGTGVLVDKQGNIFQGDFSDGSLSGMGHMTCKNGDTYVGTFKNGLFDGKGQLTYSGNVYNGNFCEGKKKGEGLIIFENGDKYEGEFDNDVYHGNGQFIQKDGKVIKGLWENGVQVRK